MERPGRRQAEARGSPPRDGTQALSSERLGEIERRPMFEETSDIGARSESSCSNSFWARAPRGSRSRVSKWITRLVRISDPPLATGAGELRSYPLESLRFGRLRLIPFPGMDGLLGWRAFARRSGGSVLHRLAHRLRPRPRAGFTAVGLVCIPGPHGHGKTLGSVPTAPSAARCHASVMLGVTTSLLSALASAARALLILRDPLSAAVSPPGENLWHRTSGNPFALHVTLAISRCCVHALLRVRSSPDPDRRSADDRESSSPDCPRSKSSAG